MNIATSRSPEVVSWLKSLGVTDLMTHVIIDIPVSGPVRVYITGLTDAKMFDVVPPDIRWYCRKTPSNALDNGHE